VVVIHGLLGCATVQTGSHLRAFRGTMPPAHTLRKRINYSEQNRGFHEALLCSMWTYGSTLKTEVAD